MPQGDRTGHMGQGAMTGRSLGFCSGYDSPGYTKGFGGGLDKGFGFGRGMGGRGRGRARGHGMALGWPFARLRQSMSWHQSVSKENEVQMLKSQAEALKNAQADIEKRLKDLEG